MEIFYILIGLVIGIGLMAVRHHVHQQRRYHAMLDAFGQPALEAACDRFVDTAIAEADAEAARFDQAAVDLCCENLARLDLEGDA